MSASFDDGSEARLLVSLRNHQSPTVTDLFDALPRDEVKALLRGLGAYMTRTAVEDLALKRAREKAKATP